MLLVLVGPCSEVHKAGKGGGQDAETTTATAHCHAHLLNRLRWRSVEDDVDVILLLPELLFPLLFQPLSLGPRGSLDPGGLCSGLCLGSGGCCG